jgi:RimJ/RimL family protein N-acetyltransferase
MQRISESDRIYLRETHIDDANFFFRLNNNPEVIKFTGDAAFTSVSAARSFLSNYDHFKKYGMGRWAVVLKENEQILGWCGLKFHPRENFVDLGFRFFQDQWGKGYATEASILSLKYGFQYLGLKRVIGRADIRNGASIRVLEKLGMTELKKTEEHGSDIIIMEVDQQTFESLYQ